MQNRIYYLFKKLQKENFDLNKVNLFSDIEKPNDKSKFAEYHSKLYTEAKLALSQVRLATAPFATLQLILAIR